MTTEYRTEYMNLTTEQKLQLVEAREKRTYIWHLFFIIVAFAILSHEVAVQGMPHIKYLVLRYFLWFFVVSLIRIILEKSNEMLNS